MNGWSDDVICPPEVGIELKNILGNGMHSSELYIIPKCGHFPHMSKTPLVYKYLIKFLKETKEKRDAS